MNTPLWAVGVALIGTVISAVASVLLKKGSKEFNLNPFKQIKNSQMLIGLFLFVISSLFYITALKNGELSIIYPVAAAQYIWISILSQKYLNEKMNKLKWLGIALIILGILLINM